MTAKRSDGHFQWPNDYLMTAWRTDPMTKIVQHPLWLFATDHGRLTTDHWQVVDESKLGGKTVGE